MSNALRVAEDQTTRAKLFDWLNRVLDVQGIGTAGGNIRLLQVEPRSFVARDWQVRPVKAEDLARLTGEISDQLLQEADAVCEGQGGGECEFDVEAYRDGDRKPWQTRPIYVKLDSGKERGHSSRKGPMDVNAELARSLSEAHKSIIGIAAQSTASFPRILSSVTDQLNAHQKLLADNLVLLRQNIENKEGREAEAWSVMQRSQTLKDLGETFVKALVPAAMQYMVPHVLPLLMDWMSKPEHSGSVNNILGLLARFAPSQEQEHGQPIQPIITAQVK